MKTRRYYLLALVSLVLALAGATVETRSLAPSAISNAHASFILASDGR